MVQCVPRALPVRSPDLSAHLPIRKSVGILDLGILKVVTVKVAKVVTKGVIVVAKVVKAESPKW